MMKEREIYLIEMALENSLTEEEKQEFENLLSQNPTLKQDYEEQLKIKGVLKKMSLKNPSSEFWDSYWTGIYNKIERGFAWVLISLSAIVLAAYGIYKTITEFLSETQLPEFIKIAIIVFSIGVAVLVISIIREKLSSIKHDKYKEIQR